MTGNRKALFDLVTGPELGEERFSAAPLWLWDPATGRPVWANGAALRLWGARDFAAFAERADPARQPCLSRLDETARSLPPAGRRIERIRLYATGRTANLTCRCAWQPAGTESYLSVTVLDRAAAGAPPGRDDPSDLPRRLLAGLEAPAMALDEEGRVLFANAAAASVLPGTGGNGGAAAAPSGLDRLARRALAEGRCGGRIDRGDAAIPVIAVRVDPNGAGPPFIALHPCEPSEAQELGADERPPLPATAADGTATAGKEARRSLEATDNILPFHMALSLSPPPPSPPQRTGLEAHERDAFRALARALGARMEGEEATEPERDPEPAAALGPDPGDASDRRPAETGTQEAEALLAHLPIGLLIYRHTVPLYANRAFLDLLGCGNFAELEKLGSVTDLLPRIKSEPGIVELRPGGGEQRMTGLVAHARDGRAIPVGARLRAVRWAGEPAILLAVSRAEAEGEPRSASAEGRFAFSELANIVNLSGDGIVVVGEDGRIGALSEQAETLLHRRSAEVAGKPFESLFTGDSRSVAADYLDGLRHHGIASVLGEGRKVRAKLPNGEELPLYLTMGEMSADGGRRYCALLRDLGPWTRTEAELIRARDAAETASAHKSDLLARISHEMRTPLNSIIGFSEVMLEGRFGNIGSDRYHDYVRDIHASGTHLLGLVNDLLDLSKVEAGKLELNFTRLDVNDLALQCMRLMLPEANQGRVIVRSSLARHLPAVVADHRSLRQILLNLLSNAVKFTLPGGQVVLSTSLGKEGEVRIRVRDTGVGMEEKDIALAMEPFRQVASAASSRKPGTGLGLPLTKALAEVNRAHFRIESSLGEGTLTEITFPPQRVLDD